LRIPRIIPYLGGLIILAFALGSLTHATPGGSLLFRAYWLLYLIFLAPVLFLGAMVAVVILIALNYREIAEAIGFGIAKRRGMRKRRSRYAIFIQVFFWALAAGVLLQTKGSILNPNHSANSTLIESIQGNNNATAPSLLQAGGFLPALSNLLQNTWLSLAFLGLLVVGGVVVIQSVRVALKEARDVRVLELKGNQEEGLQAVNEAIIIVENHATDPRSRIIACYQHLIETVSRLGVPLTPDLTARELDRAVRSTFALEGSSITQLTQLFEEARYSTHEIRDLDADKAHAYLESVAQELKIQLQSEN
jgi:Domain of unknown function (DUF4129)